MKKIKINVTLSPDQNLELKRLAKKLQKSKSAILMDGLRIVARIDNRLDARGVFRDTVNDKQEKLDLH